jgi:hypothetical protein
MTNDEIVLSTFDAIGDLVQHNVALIHAIAQRHQLHEVLAGQLVEQAIRDGVVKVDEMRMLRRV